MNPIDYIIILILVVIVGGAIRYIWTQKKSGARCIGCPSSGCCSGKTSSNGRTCSCGSKKDSQ